MVKNNFPLSELNQITMKTIIFDYIKIDIPFDLSIIFLSVRKLKMEGNNFNEEEILGESIV